MIIGYLSSEVSLSAEELNNNVANPYINEIKSAIIPKGLRTKSFALSIKFIYFLLSSHC